MFLTRPSVSQSISPVFLVSATPLKPLNRISWNSVVMKDIMCRCAYPQEILIQFFSRSYSLFELRNLTKMKDTTDTVCQRNSSETAEQNFVKLCSYEGRYEGHSFLQEMLIWSFLRGNSFWTLDKIILYNLDETGFLSHCPSLMLGIAISCIQHFQAMLERGVCELAHSFFH